MEHLLLAVIVILAIMVFALLGKIHLMHKAALEIGEAFEEKLAADTNTLIDISSRDAYLCRLAASINTQLRILRKQRNRYLVGDRELKEAVTNISHDLRTPLTAICGYLDLLEKEPLSENAVRYLSIIENRTEAMKQLTEELFQYSVITSACDDMKPDSLSLKSELEIALTGAYGMISQRGIVPEIRMPETDVKRVLDHTAVQRILGNVLTNAAKYSDGDLTVSLTEDGEIVFRNRACGLSRVEADRLFDRFYTVENAKGSTGLGLSIARELTQRLGGSIRAEWKAGSLFVVLRFPE